MLRQDLYRETVKTLREDRRYCKGKDWENYIKKRMWEAARCGMHTIIVFLPKEVEGMAREVFKDFNIRMLWHCPNEVVLEVSWSDD